MNNTNFIICKANQAQRDYVLEHFIIKDELERKNVIIYVALDENKRIVGRIIVKEKDVPLPIGGKYWFIKNLFVSPDCRRKGIASALVAEIKRQAEISNIVYFHGSANASVAASMFWLNQGFTMTAYGKKQEDTSKPEFYGNYYHFFNYCVRRRPLFGGDCSACIRSISKNEIQRLINTYATDEKVRCYYLSKADELFGFTAIGENDKVQGVILAYPDSMKPPFENTCWWIKVFVEPEYRNRGIGRALVWRLYQFAQEKGITQLANFDAEDNIGFWYELGFDIFFWGVNAETGKRGTFAMIRVK